MSKPSNPGIVALPRFRTVLPGSVLILYLIFVFLVGGSSRSDVASLPVLRGLSLLFAFWAATGLVDDDWRRIRAPLVLLLAATAWMAVQLIPLPPAIWHGLPGRDVIVAIDSLLGEADLWRPISLTPSLTWNSLLGMTVPLAVLLLAARVARDQYPRVMLAFVVIACASALLGTLQILSGQSSAAYFYRITSSDAMVGLFANRNHHAVFLACVILIIAGLVRDEAMRKRKRALFRSLLLIAGILLTSMTVLVGSRVGFMAGVVAFAVGYVVVAVTWKSGSIDQSGGHPVRLSRIGQFFLYLPPLILTAFLGVALWLSDRQTALTRLAGQDVAGDLRIRAWPTVQSLIETHWLFGSGFGSFANVYKMVEPDELLQLAYFNRAHNDWAELAITAGLPFMVIMLAAIIWLVRAAIVGGMRNLMKGYRGDVRLPALTALVLLAAASFADYPLRVPSVQAMALVLTIFLCCPKPSGMSRD